MEGLQPIERMDRKVLPSREMLLMQMPTLLSRRRETASQFPLLPLWSEAA